MKSRVAQIVGAAVLLVPLAAARADDEIQVYNAEIAKAGQWTLETHFNYAIAGRQQPDFDGGLVPHHALNGTPELAYGVNDWSEMGFYAPYAIDRDGNVYSNGGKFRQLFVVPDAAKRDFFYGVNVELSYTTPKFSQTKYASEIRPIIGWRNGDFEFIVNPIVDIGIGSQGESEFLPAARLARRFSDDLALGVEYYSNLGPFGAFLPLSQQRHNLFGVMDFKIGATEINVGIGYGLTPGSDRLLAKLILGWDLN